MRSQTIICIGALSGFLSVAAGAFGAHGLRSRLNADLLAIFETGARYQMYHALLLILCGILAVRGTQAAAADFEILGLAAIFLIAGTVLFSGSLYALALSGQRFFGAITPFGGLCFLAGWLTLAYAALRIRT